MAIHPVLIIIPGRENKSFYSVSQFKSPECKQLAHDYSAQDLYTVNAIRYVLQIH